MFIGRGVCFDWLSCVFIDRAVHVLIRCRVFHWLPCVSLAGEMISLA